MITENEAREAAKNIPAIALLEMSPPVCDVLKWAACELSRREAERAERAKPIDVKWLQTLGFYAGHDLAWHLDRVSCRQYAQHVTDPVDSTLLVDDVEVVWHATRGQLLDLLAALKGGA